MIIDTRYKVIERLGMGAWATVYKVRDLRSQGIYALKIFHKLDSKSLYSKFSAEDMFMITQLDHPNLTKVHSFGNADEHIYYLSEYFEGETLSNFSFTNATIEDLYEIIVQICYGLAELHFREIVHKDLKPENIIFNAADNKLEVKILDFGFTKIDLQKNQQHISGTLPYIAPEVFRGHKAVPESDFFSLGVTLYRVTTGTLPYTLEQLSELISGARSGLFPKFPRELNPTIPAKLEKLILKLLSYNIEDRFSDALSIINYINRIQPHEFSVSSKYSLVNSIKYGSELIREKYTHDLLDYLPLVNQKNGKVVVLSGEEGLGKNNILTLFRYHLLSSEYHLFDYTCTPKMKDPFFALMKEYISSAEKNRKISKALGNVSDKLRKFLFESEEKASVMQEDNSDLVKDYQFAKNFIKSLSEDRPLIFLIRAGHFLTSETIGFINLISKTIRLNRVLIVLAVDNPGSVSGLIHPIQITLEPLSFEETTEYLKKLLTTDIPGHFSHHIHVLSNGNPTYIREILIDLIDKKLLRNRNRFDFKINWELYRLPPKIIHGIYSKLSHVTEENYHLLQRLAITFTPLSLNLIKHLLKLNEKELFRLIQDSTNNHILVKAGNYYLFSHQEIRDRLFSENTPSLKREFSEKVLAYFNQQEITQISICEGIIKNARIADAQNDIRKYTLHLAKLYLAAGEQETAFEMACEVITLDFKESFDLAAKDLLTDLSFFQETAELTGKVKTALKLLDSIPNMPEIFEKHYIKGILNNACEDFSQGLKELQTALDIAITGKQRIETLINLMWTALLLKNYELSASYLNILKDIKMSAELEVAYIDRKGLFLYKTGKRKEAIQLMENYKKNLNPIETTGYYIKLGNFYNNLAFFYSGEKSFDEALQHFLMAKRLWERIKYKRSLGMVYNNIGDLALRQGDALRALESFKKSKQICDSIEHLRCEVLTNLNFGEAYNKMGKYQEAQVNLLLAQEKAKEMSDTSFDTSIIDNLAIAKSKTEGFANYYFFVKESAPQLIRGEITSIDPLVKTYIQFLLDLGLYNQVTQIFVKNTKIDYIGSREEEFFYQVLGLLNLYKGQYNEALDYFNTSYEYAERNRSTFAQIILNSKMIQCYLFLNNIDKAKEMYHKTFTIAKRNHYNYWVLSLRLIKVQIDLVEGSKNIRLSLRNLLSILASVKQNAYFLLEMKTCLLLHQAYLEQNSIKLSRKYYNQYKNAVNNSVNGLPARFRKSFIQKTEADVSIEGKAMQVSIAKKSRLVFDPWQEQLYELLKLHEVDRFKFFIGKMLKKLFAPHYYGLVLIDDYNKRYRHFLTYEVQSEELFRSDHEKNIRDAIRLNELIITEIMECNVLYIPLRFKSIIVGCLIIGDGGELPFTRREKSLARELRLHLTSLLLRIKDISEINDNIHQMNQLMVYSNEAFSFKDPDKIEQEFISFCIDFARCNRAFLIKKDVYGNFVFQMAMDASKNLLEDHSHISKTVLSQVYNSKCHLLTLNATVDSTLKNSISVQDYQLHSIYCAPILIDDEVHGLLYIDNHDSDKIELQLNLELMEILLMQTSIALKNANQYSQLMKKNRELHTLDIAKNEFINLITHELNTPLMTLQNQMARLRKQHCVDENKTDEVFTQTEETMKRIMDKLNDIFSFTKYSLLTTLPKNNVDVKSLLEVICNEASIISKDRKMRIDLEVKDQLPDIEVNWEAFYLMIYQIILNAIRYTKDFGNIKVGARRSSFQNEEIDNKETLVVYVQDNGLGIAEQDMENIFVPFHELGDIYSHHSGTVEFKSGGLGLGLSTAKKIVELHSGKIQINSKEGQGTTVFVIIPINQDQTINNL